jgi:hypothetical protein
MLLRLSFKFFAYIKGEFKGKIRKVDEHSTRIKEMDFLARYPYD